MSGKAMIEIDGSEGEGGGQVLRTALSLSMITGQAFRIAAIRRMRDRSGLMRQHLTAVRAAQEICGAEVAGAEIGSSELVFKPNAIRSGAYAFRIGTAGSTTLVAQTVLPALMIGTGPSTVVLEGGTHNGNSPPFDFLDRCFLPVLRNMGADVVATLERPGFYPAGGGSIALTIAGNTTLSPIDLPGRGASIDVSAQAVVANLSPNIARRELAIVARRLGWPEHSLQLVEENRASGPGNVLMLTLAFEEVTELFSGFGRIGITAEAVAERTVEEVRRYLSREVAVGPWLADQLLLPMAMAGGGRFTTTAPTPHAMTNADIIQRFVPVRIEWEDLGKGAWMASIERTSVG